MGKKIALAKHRKTTKADTVPRVASNANGTDGTAGKPNLSGDSSSGDAKETQEKSSDRVASIRGAVAALDSASVALVGRRASSRDSHSEGGESESGESRESEELHVCLREWLGW